MFKVLLNKQIQELLAGSLGNRVDDNGQPAPKPWAFIGMATMIYFVLFRLFWSVALSLCYSICGQGSEYNWVYFALMALFATLIGVIASVFTASSMLYQAKDNDMLMAMPIPQWMLILVRMAMIYLTSAFMELLVLVPTFVLFFIGVKAPIWYLPMYLILILVIPVVAVVISCLIGWLMAVANSKFGNRAIIGVSVALVFIALFYYVFWNAYQYLDMLIENIDAVGNGIRIVMYPFYLMGQAAGGRPLLFFAFVAIVAAMFAVTFYLISKNFIGMISVGSASVKKKVVIKKGKREPVFVALVKKEFRRFASSSVVMLSCAMGSLMMAVIGVGSFFAGEWIITQLFGMTNGANEIFPLFASVMIGAMIAMNTLASSTISLEGKHFWMLKTLPLPAKDVFKAKLCLHGVLTAIPAVFCSVALAIVGEAENSTMILMVIFAVIFTAHAGTVGLLCNLRFPVLDWNNEMQAVKQNMSVIVGTFTPWILLILLAVLGYVMLNLSIAPDTCLITGIVIVVIATVPLFRRLMKTGVEQFENL